VKLVVCIGTACALHVAVIATLHGGSPHAVDATGPVQAIEVDEIVAPRILTEEEPTHQEPATTQLAPRVGSPSVRVVATSPATPAASNDDVVPQPPVNTPVTPHFHMPSQLGNDGRAMATTMPVEQTFAESDVTERATFSSGARAPNTERAGGLGG
jgi:hypothetical protein